jgi:uncharacterized LabA/DUF88 family protein
MATAILVDGGFYRKNAFRIWGEKTAKERVDELMKYCWCHISDSDNGQRRSLYRIFYYDCPPIKKTIYNPVTKKNEDLGKSDTYKWSEAFLEELSHRRKVALRLGKLSDISTGYRLKRDVFKDLCAQKRGIETLTVSDIQLDIVQKGVDMKLGLDILDLAYKKLVSQIVLISGDSDFVPAAKMARREGIDFILDPMKGKVSNDLMEHIDGMMSHWRDARLNRF